MDRDTLQQRWEDETALHRLTHRHLLALKKAESQKQRNKEILKCASKLGEKMAIWKYIPGGKPPDVEMGWIIHSQIAWKGTEIEEEDLWEDLPETDPKRIIELDEVGPSVEDLLPAETRLLLRRILDELELHGIRIKDQEYSLNWELPTSAAKSSRGKSGLKFNKKTLGPTKYLHPKRGSTKNTPKGKKKGKGKKSSLGILGSFFGLG